MSRGVYKPVGTIPPFLEEQEEITGFYLSGLTYNRDIGVTLFDRGLGIDEAEQDLREYASLNVTNYNDDFYGIAEISYNNEPLGVVNEINL